MPLVPSCWSTPRSTCLTWPATSPPSATRSTRPSSSSRETETVPGLEDLYREIILDHYRNPRNRGELPIPPAHRVEGFNPLCGDEIVVYLEVQDGVVSDLRIGGQ